MSNTLRAVCIFFGVTLSVFLSLSTWYWIGFKEPAVNALAPLQKATPTLSRMFQEHEDESAEQILSKVPFDVIVSDAGGVAITSNLSRNPRQRKRQGEFVLKNEDLPFLKQGDYRYYYRAPVDWIDLHLLFPLIFGLLLGLIATVWDYLQREHLNDQTDALILMSQQQHDEDAQHERVKALQQENKQLKQKLKTRTIEPRKNSSAALADFDKLQEALQRVKEQNLALKKNLNQRKQGEDSTALNAQLTELSETLATTQDYEQAMRQQIVEYEEQLHLMYAHQKNLQNELDTIKEQEETARERIHDLHRLEREHEGLRRENDKLLKKEEAWKKEKVRVLSVAHGKEEQNKKLRENLKDARLKLRDLSVKYKKLTEKVAHLPADLQEAQQMIDELINAKDLAEQANVDLSLDKAERSAEVKRLHKELRARSDRLKQAQRMIEELAENLKTYQREMAELSATLEDKMLDLEYAQDLHDEDQQVLTEITQERDLLKLEMEQLKESLDNLRDDKARLAFENQNLETQLADMDVEKYQLEIDQLRQSLQLMGNQQQRRAQVVEELKDKLKQGEQLYNKLKSHSEGQSREMAGLRQEIDRYRSEVAILEEKIFELENAQYGGK